MEWISVDSPAKPSDEQEVITWDGYEVQVSHFMSGLFWGDPRYGCDGKKSFDSRFGVTHWMPLPTPPSE